MESSNSEPKSLEQFMKEGKTKITWAIDRILAKAGVLILAGPPGCGKSWLLHELAIELSRGEKWLGVFPTLPGRVLYIDEESSPDLLRQRMHKLLLAKGIQSGQLDVFVTVGSGLNLSTERSTRRLQRLLRDCSPNYVIIDSLVRVHNAEENSATEMAQVFRCLKGLMQQFGCSFVIADHQRKPGQFQVSPQHLLRGSSEKVASTDSLLSLRQNGDYVEVYHSKSRSGIPIESFMFSVEDPDDATTVLSYHGEITANYSASRSARAKEAVTAILREANGSSRKSLVEEAKKHGLSEKALDSALKLLEESGDIRRKDRKAADGRGGKAAYYHLLEKRSRQP